jgi:hypothetical protein
MQKLRAVRVQHSALARRGITLFCAGNKSTELSLTLSLALGRLSKDIADRIRSMESGAT